MQKKAVNFRYLSEPDMIKAGVLDVKRCVEVMDETFKLLGIGDYVMSGHNLNGHGALIVFPEDSPFPDMPKPGPDRRYMAMPAYLGGRFRVCGLKWYGSNVENANKGLPRSVLMAGLNDADTGEPLCIMSANLLSSIRTGSVPAVAAKYLAKEGAKSLGVVGCGVINHSCARGILYSLPSVDKVYIYDLLPEKAAQFGESLKKEFAIEYFVVDSLQECCQDSDVISVAAAGANKIYIEPGWLKAGSLLAIIGSAVLDQDFLLSSRIVFDHWLMHKCWLEEGIMSPGGLTGAANSYSTYPILKLYNEGVITEKDFCSLGDIACGKAQVRKSNEDRVVFYSGGLPVEDVSWAYECYQQALAKGIGQDLNVWQEAYLG